MSDRKCLVFVTRSGNPVTHPHVYRQFVKAGHIAGIDQRVTPHVLRASLVTYLKGQNYSDADISKITGHTSVDMVTAYDKRCQRDNISDRIELF